MMKPIFGSLFALAIWAMPCFSFAGEKEGTIFLKDADSYVGKAPLIPRVIAEPSPTPRPQASTPVPVVRHTVDEEDVVASCRSYPVAVIHRSTITVGQEIPVPNFYAAPQVVPMQGGGVTVVPATPVSFEKIQTGTTLGSDGAGNVSLRDSEVSGFVNYGNRIKTGVPVYDRQGHPSGTQAITVSPNPVIAPVTTTVEIK